MTVTGEDLRRAARFTHGALAPHGAADWSRPAGALAWSCRRTLDHMPDALTFYAANLAARSTERVRGPRDGDASASIPALLDAVVSTAGILAALAESCGPDDRAFHPAGMADAEGFCAMACDELLVHTWDVATGLGVDAAGPSDLAGSVLARLFPWADAGADPWAALLWANGRISLEGRPGPDADWWWHCAPLAEWDGTVRRRRVPPAW